MIVGNYCGEWTKMTSESSTNQQQDNSYEARVKKVSRRIRHIGFAIFGGMALATAGVLLYNVLVAMSNDEVYDPMTHERVVSAQARK